MTPSSKKKIIVVLGKSGSGKGTQVERLASLYNLKVISSGTLLRARAKQDDFVGKRIAEIIDKGGLVPTPTIFHLWLHELEAIQNDSTSNGIIFEGSPRKVYEARLLDEVLWFYHLDGEMRVLHLDITDEVVIQRLLSRGRNDDEIEAIKTRLEWYQEKVNPVVKYYKEKGILTAINGDQSMDDVAKDITENVKEFFA